VLWLTDLGSKGSQKLSGQSMMVVYPKATEMESQCLLFCKGVGSEGKLL
jgi:hypothetical protein